MLKVKEEQKPNRLINEKSPYLLQHARNPVDWYPWGDDAFQKAKDEDKPIFLSIGYSTCHWCHVMAHESFEDPEVAKLMNEAFVNIKVDREERPEIDNIYMTVCQMITGTGGWPLTIIMDADKKPFTAGTYFPKESKYGRIGMLDLIPKIKDYWDNNREELKIASKEVLAQLQEIEFKPGEGLSKEILEEAFKEATILFDNKNGGFKGAPKFPTPHKLLFLLRYWYRTKDPNSLEIVEKTLQAMRKGGIYDHIGFGFHRYSTDSTWLLPHFEKMLYDQALLAIAYTETYHVTKDEFYRKVADEIFEYVIRDMRSPQGGFYSAEDADSEGEEGRFYTWTIDEISDILGEESDLFMELYNFEREGNFVEESTRERTGRNIPFLRSDLEGSDLKRKIEDIRKRLFEARKKRIHPHKDDKILTDWNALFITALAIAGRVFNNQKYIQIAKDAIEFIFTKLVTKQDKLLHRFRENESAIPGMINDYSFLIWALLELYESTFNTQFLQRAVNLNEILLENFWDKSNGGFYFTSEDSEELIVRKKEIYDGAIPSGNSVAMLNLLKLSRILGNLDFEEKAMTINKVFSSSIEQALLAHSMFLSGLEYFYGQSFEVVIVGVADREDTNEMISALRSKYIPHKVVLFVPDKQEEAEIYRITDFVKFKSSKDDKATAHVCINRFCKFPTNEISKMFKDLKV